DGIEFYLITTNNADEDQPVGGDNTVGGSHWRIQINEDASVSFPSDGDIISDIAMAEVAGGYVAEIRMDMENLLSYRVDAAVTLTPGTTQMGFDAFVNDSDDGETACDEECRSALIGWNDHANAVYNSAAESGKINFTDEVVSGLDDVSAQNAAFDIYPNPARNVLYISSDVVLPEIRISNMLGQQVVLVNDYSDGIDISGLNAGIYFVTAEGSSQVLVVD
ncbi:MAG: T9SS type A sorting domain-containing protein, partial [Bacteroidales bacterium]